MVAAKQTIVDATIEAVLSELDNIYTLNNTIKMLLKAFLAG